MAEVRITYNSSELRQLLSGSNGPVAQDLRRRANAVLRRARELVPKGGTGNLKRSLAVEMSTVAGNPVAKVGSRGNVKYAIWQHEGTGIYAGRGLIRPKRAKALRWPGVNNQYRSTGGNRRYSGGRTGGYVYAKYAKGVPPTPYLTDALPEALK